MMSQTALSCFMKLLRSDLLGRPEKLILCLVSQYLCVIHGSMVFFSVSPASHLGQTIHIHKAFTATKLCSGPHTYPVTALQRKYRLLKDFPLAPVKDVYPLLLTGSDCPLITSIMSMRLGPPDGAAAMKTCLGWTIQGLSHLLKWSLTVS